MSRPAAEFWIRPWEGGKVHAVPEESLDHAWYDEYTLDFRAYGRAVCGIVVNGPTIRYDSDGVALADVEDVCGNCRQRFERRAS